MAGKAPGERSLDPGIKLVLGELRDLRVEMRADRQRSDEQRRQADEAWQEERRRADEQLRQDRAAADERLRQERLEFNQFLQEMRDEFREFREDSSRREAVMHKEFTDASKQVHTVGLAIVKTLNRHTQILERIDQRLVGPGNGRRGRDDGRGR